MDPKTKVSLRIAGAAVLGVVLGMLYSVGTSGFYLGMLVGLALLEGVMAVLSRKG